MNSQLPASSNELQSVNSMIFFFFEAHIVFDVTSGSPVRPMFVPFNISIFLLELVLLFGTARYYLHLAFSKFLFYIQLFVQKALISWNRGWY